jgi:hypothetical protein
VTEPMTPPDCDLRGLPFMPLDVARLSDSDLVALSTGDEFKAAVILWCKSWLQVPAASLPDDDRVLAHLTGLGPRWKKVRPMALHGWVKCDDGRLYHPVVADKAREAWKHRQSQRERANKRWGNAAASGDGNAAAYAMASHPAMQGTGTVKGEGEESPNLRVITNAADAPDGAGGYAFEGKVIKLNARDLKGWRRTFHSIPDLDAELSTLDGWFQGDGAHKAENWFHVAKGALNRRHQDNIRAQQEPARVPIC